MKTSLKLILFLFGGFCLLFSCAKGSGYGSTNNTGGGGSASTNITISGMAYTPSSVTVKKGAVIKWTNNDYGAHTVTADNGTSFNSGDIAAGGTYSYTASIVDTFKYHCTIHGLSMAGTLIVIP